MSEKKWIFKARGSEKVVLQGTIKRQVMLDSGTLKETKLDPIIIDFPRETLTFTLTEKVAEKLGRCSVEDFLQLMKESKQYNRNFKLVSEPDKTPTEDQKAFAEAIDKKAEASEVAVIAGTRSLGKRAKEK